MLTVATNAKIKASSQYTNFEFASMARFNGISVGANDNGIFSLCCGDDDSGVQIDAYFEGVLSNFGITNPKRFRYLYFGLESEGDLTLHVTVDQEDPVEYEILTHKINQQRTRVAINRSEHGSYWSFKISNQEGQDFSMDLIKGLPIVRSSGII